MAQLKHCCGRPACYFFVDEGTQCDNRNKWHHIMCSGLTPAAYKRCCKPLSCWFCKECSSTKSLLILQAIELLNKAKKLPCDKQAAEDEQNFAFEEIKSVIISPALDLNETIKMNLIREADKHMYEGIVTRRKKCAEKKKLSM